MKTLDEAIGIGVARMPAYESILDEVALNPTAARYVQLFAERVESANLETVLWSVLKLGVVVGIEMERAQDLG